jgi:hypothetical protein
MLLRVDMPGLCFEELELRFDARGARLSYRPDALDDLLAWNEAGLDAREFAAPEAMHELLVACYVQWRCSGGTGNAAMEASLAAAVAVGADALPLLRPSLWQRAGVGLQRWMGLLDFQDECEAV